MRLHSEQRLPLRSATFPVKAPHKRRHCRVSPAFSRSPAPCRPAVAGQAPHDPRSRSRSRIAAGSRSVHSGPFRPASSELEKTTQEYTPNRPAYLSNYIWRWYCESWFAQFEGSFRLTFDTLAKGGQSDDQSADAVFPPPGFSPSASGVMSELRRLASHVRPSSFCILPAPAPEAYNADSSTRTGGPRRGPAGEGKLLALSTIFGRFASMFRFLLIPWPRTTYGSGSPACSATTQPCWRWRISP